NLGQQEKGWATGCHLAGLAILTGIPMANIIAPLIVWLIKKNEYEFVDLQGKEALNFQISMSIYAGIVFLLFMLGIIEASGGGLFFGYANFSLMSLVFVIGLVDLIFAIIAGIKASNGEMYRYPLTIRFIK
ncbi:MAG: DUF4870 domain-containing protein, partial [Syntrophomonadaceae bacterium]|nr:DUF4870 domain-containing protein [Syntrophomonadaceae bacterium]